MVVGLNSLRKRGALAATAVCYALAAGTAAGQTAFGSSTAIVFPLTANTSTFTSTVTLFNPNPAPVTVGLNYYDANNTTVPGQKPCTDIVVAANSSVEFGVPAQCTLDPDVGHFGQLIAFDVAATSQIYGYSRTQNNAGAGFSVEGFPSANFSTEKSAPERLISGAWRRIPMRSASCFSAASRSVLLIASDMQAAMNATG